MKYETAPITPKRFIKRKAAAKYTNDINKLGTLLILAHLYKRHATLVWEMITVVTWTLLIVNKIS